MQRTCRCDLSVRMLFLVTLIFIGWPRDCRAIPVFARVYQTSCVTCHVAPPKLTPFGEVFRQNGYEIPNDDGESVKEEPQKLGADAYKRVWPKAIWPGAIPGKIPLAFRGRTGFSLMQTDSGVYTHFIPPTLQLLMAGTLGEHLTFFVGAHLFDAGELGSVDRFYLQFDNILSSVIPPHLLFLRAGQFIPEMVPFLSNHRSLTLTPYAMNTYDASLGNTFSAGHAHGESSFGIENLQIGAELSGVVAQRLRYVAGIVNGSGPNALDNNQAKDFYGRLSYKFGGMSFTDPGGIVAQSGKNWVEQSLVVGVFGYKGAKPNAGYVRPKDLDFYRVGGDLSLSLWDLNLFGGFIRGVDEKVVGTRLGTAEYNLFFAEANCVVFPWLIPVVRYEQALADTIANGPRRLVANLTFLVRANVKIVAEVPVDVVTRKVQRLEIGTDVSF